jgi:hypothetical protein
LQEAISIFCDFLSPLQKVHSKDKRVCSLLNVILKEIANNNDWNYNKNIEENISLGRNLSINFYEASKFKKAKGLLRKNISGFDIEYDDFYNDRLAIMGYDSLKNVITIRYNFNQDINIAFSYPLYFMHEFVAHIYGSNSDSDIFEDGWMIFAIQQYLSNNRENICKINYLQFASLLAFNNDFPEKLGADSLNRLGYFVAYSLYNLCPEEFWKITYLLSETDPQQVEEAFHAYFVRRVNKYLEENKIEKLKDKLKSSNDINKIFSLL